jgi:hypothetical protein
VGNTQLLGDFSTGVFRPLLPAAYRAVAIRSLNDMHHPGVRATTRLVKAAFCWPKMDKDILKNAIQGVSEARYTATFLSSQRPEVFFFSSAADFFAIKSTFLLIKNSEARISATGENCNKPFPFPF